MSRMLSAWLRLPVFLSFLSLALVVILSQMVSRVSVAPKNSSAANAKIAQAFPVHGQVVYRGTQRIVQLWGTNYEMGYAHGYLLAEDVMHMVEDFFIGNILRGLPNTDVWTTYQNRVEKEMNFGRYLQEVEGLYDGMVASGKDIYVDRLDRQLSLADLKLWVAIEVATSIGSSEACSSFSVWGSASSDSQTLHARNFDFPYDTPNAYDARLLTIFALEPVGKQKIVTISWPGSIGITSGINQAGLVLTVNVSNGLKNVSGGSYEPVPLTLRRILEDSISGDLFDDALGIFTSISRTGSFNSQLSQPTSPTVTKGSLVVEADAAGEATRNPLQVNSYVYATNHFIERDPSYNPGNSSVNRYNTITSAMNYATTHGDRKVDKNEALLLLQNITQSATVSPSLYSLIAQPDSGIFDIYFARFSGTPLVITQAPFTTGESYTWDEFFAGIPTPTPLSTPTPTPTRTPTSTPASCSGSYQSCLTKPCCSGYYCNSSKVCMRVSTPYPTPPACAGFGQSCASKRCCSGLFCVPGLRRCL